MLAGRDIKECHLDLLSFFSMEADLEMHDSYESLEVQDSNEESDGGKCIAQWHNADYLVHRFMLVFDDL